MQLDNYRLPGGRIVRTDATATKGARFISFEVESVNGVRQFVTATRVTGDLCWTTRDEFLNAIGVVNAEIKVSKFAIRYSTKYTVIADRIEALAKSSAARYLRTLTDDCKHVITVRGFYNGKGRTL